MSCVRFGGRRREIGLGLAAGGQALAEALKRGRASSASCAGARWIRLRSGVGFARSLPGKARAAKPVTFGDETERFLDEHAPDWKRSNARTAWLSSVERVTPLPLIKQKSVDVIDVADVHAIIAADRERRASRRVWRQGPLAD